LLALQLKPQLKQIDKGPPGFTQLALQLRAATPPDRLLADVLLAIHDRALLSDDPLPRSERAFAQQKDRARARLPAVNEAAGRLLGAIAADYHALNGVLSALPPALHRLATDVREQRDALVYPGFFSATPWEQLQHLPRYLQAAGRRIAKYGQNPERDARHAQALRERMQRYMVRRNKLNSMSADTADLDRFRWTLEELRVSLFAQELKTPYPISLKRLDKLWLQLTDG
jgi:ATP-dependent helicase HrpA